MACSSDLAGHRWRRVEIAACALDVCVRIFEGNSICHNFSLAIFPELSSPKSESSIIKTETTAYNALVLAQLNLELFPGSGTAGAESARSARGDSRSSLFIMLPTPHSSQMCAGKKEWKNPAYMSSQYIKTLCPTQQPGTHPRNIQKPSSSQ